MTEKDALSAAAAAAGKDVPTVYLWLTCLWVFTISMCGGIVGFLRKRNNGKRPFSFFELIGELCISGFVGLLTFFLCYWSGIFKLGVGLDEQLRSAAITAFLVGMASHMGSRALAIFEQMTVKKLERLMDEKEPQ